jgi:hypothetical protein
VKSLILLALLCTGASAADAKKPAAEPKTVTVELGKKFVLRPGQTAKFKGEDASVRIIGFTNSPCPKGARCVWSGQAVHLELTVAGSTVALGGAAPYVVETVDSDYKTRATLKATPRKK